jgi:hypothetical protein
MKGHKKIYCRKPAQYSGNHHGSHSGNQQSGRLNDGSNYGGQRFHGNRRDGNKSQRKWRNQEGSYQCTEKPSSEGGAGNPYTSTFIAETGNSESYLSTKKTITWVLDSGATHNLVKEDTHVVNKYELPVPTKIHIAKNDNYLLAYANGDIIAESCVHGEVRNIKILDVFLVKDLPYNLLSVSNLDRKGFIINIDNSKAKIIKNSTVVGIANRDGNLYKLSMTVKEVDDSGAYSAVNMKNSKIWHSRFRFLVHLANM